MGKIVSKHLFVLLSSVEFAVGLRWWNQQAVPGGAAVQTYPKTKKRLGAEQDLDLGFVHMALLFLRDAVLFLAPAIPIK